MVHVQQARLPTLRQSGRRQFKGLLRSWLFRTGSIAQQDNPVASASRHVRRNSANVDQNPDMAPELVRHFAVACLARKFLHDLPTRHAPDCANNLAWLILEYTYGDFGCSLALGFLAAARLGIMPSSGIKLQPDAARRCFGLSRPTQEQLASHTTEWFFFGRLFEPPGLFRQPLFKGGLVLDRLSPVGHRVPPNCLLN
jgi:hypothetical protein